MDKKQRKRFLKFFKDEQMYDLGTLSFILNNLKTTCILFKDNEYREVFSIGIEDNKYNRDILSKYINDLDEFFKELGILTYDFLDGEHQFIDVVAGAHDIDLDINCNEIHVKLGHKYHESQDEYLFYVYSEDVKTSLSWL